MSLPSTMRCSRSHVVNGRLLSTRGWISARSMATTAKPPACSTRLSALMARSTMRSVERCVHSEDGSTANPQQPIEIDAGGRRAGDVEAIARVNQRGDLAATRGGADQVKKERGAPRRVRSGKLRDLTARQPPLQEPAAQERVDGCDVERDKRGGVGSFKRRQRRRERAIELSRPQRSFQSSQRDIRHMFASRTIGEYQAKIQVQLQTLRHNRPSGCCARTARATLRDVAWRSVHAAYTMICIECIGQRRERLLYAQSSECKACGHRVRVRRPAIAMIQFFCARHLRRRLKRAS